MSTNGSSFVPAGGLAPGKLPNGNGASHGIGPEPLPAIAIIGMGMRLPGAIRTADALWETLAEKRSTQCDISATRFSTTGFYNASNLPGCISIQKGFFLEDDLSRLDTSFFSMGIKEVNGMDPQQRMLLEVVYECLESSGQTNWRGSNTACYVGVWGEDWLDLHAKDPCDFDPSRLSGGHDFAISNRISYEYDFKGPSFTVKAGCSSSLVALHEAVRALQLGDCDSAIVAGTNLIFSPTMSMAMCEQGVLSLDGLCKTFDAAANGYARGEAINAILLKPLGAALKNNDPVRAVIRATSSNSDGKTQGMSMPSSEGHEALIRKAYQAAGLDPSDTVFVEAHGTGTIVGDPIEANAIARVFGWKERVLYIGSVKPNLGHSEGASGISSIIKAVLALEHKAIPPNINFSTPNPKIPFEAANVAVPQELVPWPDHQPLRASVNSFGIGGANAHCIIESLEEYLAHAGNAQHACTAETQFHAEENPPTCDGSGVRISKCNGTSQTIYDTDLMETVPLDRSMVGELDTCHPSRVLYVLSSENAISLQQSLSEHKNFFQKHIARAPDISYTLCNRRQHLSHRSYCVASTTSSTDAAYETLEFATPAIANSTNTKVNMVFTGQGSQWVGMANELMSTYSSFRETISRLNYDLSQLEHPPNWDLAEELQKPEETNNMGKAEFSQPLICAVQIGLVNLLHSWGVFPAAVVGHSSGEIAAAYAAGAITAGEAITIAYYRGYVNSDRFSPQSGGMVAIGMGSLRVTPYLVTGVVMACENSPESVTLSGDKYILHTVCQTIRQKEPECLMRELKVDKAYHSPHMKNAGAMFEAFLSCKIQSKSPKIPFFSTVRAKQVQQSEALGATYWRENIESPVLFSAAVDALLDQQASSPNQIFVEIGPHSTLAGPLRQIFHAKDRGKLVYASAMVRGRDCLESILKLVGDLFLVGVPVDLSQLVPTGKVVTDLPPRSWNHEREFWDEPRLSKEWRFRRFPHHELLGSRTLESSSLQPEWRNAIKLDHVQWLRDHQVVSDVVFPFAGYLAMAIEAARQAVESVDEGYSFRNVNVQSALVLYESKPVEIVTTFRPVRLTNNATSVWWEFTIVSHNGVTWTKHCDGEIRRGRDSHHAKETQQISLSTTPKGAHRCVYPRIVGDMYPDIYRIGLKYGSSFQGLGNVCCQPRGAKAVATLQLMLEPQSSYAIHPTTIDNCLQLFYTASCDGLFHQADKLYLPVHIGEMHVAGSQPQDFDSAVVEATIAANTGGTLSGAATVCNDDGVILLSLRNALFSPLEDTSSRNGSSDSELVAAAYMEWYPQFDLAAKTNILIGAREASGNEVADAELLEKLILLSLPEVQERLADIFATADSVPEHIIKYHAWITSQIRHAESGTHWGSTRAATKELLSLGREARKTLQRQLTDQALQSTAARPATLVSRVIDHIEDVAQGRMKSIELLEANDGLKDFYDYASERSDLTEFFAAAGRTRPLLRVLEIGAGTGSTTKSALDNLTNGGGAERYYSAYTYTDISAGFFVAARERFKMYPGLEFQVLDISKNPLGQGFAPKSFDLIIASNVLHATPLLSETLANVHKLLDPEGYLLLQELSPVTRAVSFVMGILPGWWAGAADGRPEEPYISPEQWDGLLKVAGFTGVDSVVYDAPYPYQMNANMTTRPASTVSIGPPGTLDITLGQNNAPSRITILHKPGDAASTPIVNLQAVLSDSGFTVDLISIQEHQRFSFKNQDMVISLLELELPFFETISASDLSAFQKLVGCLGSTQLLWILRPAQENIDASSKPGFGLSLGLMRTLRSEQLLAITTIEVDRVDDKSFQAITSLLKCVLIPRLCNSAAGGAPSAIDPDREYMLVDGIIKVGRYRPVSLSKELALDQQRPEALTLGIEQYGLLQSLTWAQSLTREPGEGEVVVEVRCAGLNFRDLLVCMGIIADSAVGIGMEGSGVVTAVGPGVTDLQRGDHVLYVGDNCFSTQLTLSSRLCAKFPASISFEQAATMPCVYATVIHALLDVGGLRPGQSILIHSACGGIGIAALNICKSINDLTIYVTVGSEAKAKHLMSVFGLPRENIFNSRDSSFLYDVKAATGGRGVDVVLNSLAGELLHASWKCVAPYGKMLEIGKRDFIGKVKLDMDLFEANRSFIGIDLLSIVKQEHGMISCLLKRMIQMLISGAIHPIEPLKVFDALDIEDALRYMQNGTHVGKLVVAIPTAGQSLPYVPKLPSVELNSSATYVLVGGLGGIGRSVATWMVQRGARHIFFFSRHAGENQHDQDFFRELECQGCKVTAFQGNVANIADVNRVLACAPQSHPVRGVLQMSMVLRDKSFADMSFEDWEAPLKTKVEGSWNLHTSAPKDLDFFVVIGSLSGSCGSTGQANYAAGNTYLTSLVQYRRALGLPAAVLHLGPVEDIGYLKQNPRQAEAVRTAGTFFLRTRQLLYAMNWALATNRPKNLDNQLTIGLRSERSMSDPANRIIWKRDARMGLYHNLTTASHMDGMANTSEDDESANTLRLFIASVEADPQMLEDPASVKLVTREVGRRIFMFMLKPVEEMDPEASLTSIGMDSLVIVEIRNWIKRSFGGVEFSVLELLNAGTIQGLGTLVVGALKTRFAAALDGRSKSS